MSDDLNGWDPALATRQMSCERCGTGFGCKDKGEAGTCWCSLESFKLPQPLPDAVGPFGDCLCPKCLREVAAQLEQSRE